MTDAVRDRFEKWNPVLTGAGEVNKYWARCGFFAGYQASQADAAAYREAVNFIYESIGRDFGHLEPLDAAKAWMNAVLDKEANVEHWKARCIAAENGHPQVKEAVADMQRWIDHYNKQLDDAAAIVDELVGALTYVEANYEGMNKSDIVSKALTKGEAWRGKC